MKIEEADKTSVMKLRWFIRLWWRLRRLIRPWWELRRLIILDLDENWGGCTDKDGVLLLMSVKERCRSAEGGGDKSCPIETWFYFIAFLLFGQIFQLFRIWMIYKSRSAGIRLQHLLGMSRAVLKAKIWSLCQQSNCVNSVICVGLLALLIPNTLGNRKGDCGEVARGDKHYLRKYTNGGYSQNGRNHGGFPYHEGPAGQLLQSA